MGNELVEILQTDMTANSKEIQNGYTFQVQSILGNQLRVTTSYGPPFASSLHPLCIHQPLSPDDLQNSSLVPILLRNIKRNMKITRNRVTPIYRGFK
jgi:hypothetical protein